MVPPHGRATAIKPLRRRAPHGHEQTPGELKISFFFRLAAAASRPKPPYATDCRNGTVSSRVLGRLAAAKKTKI